MRDPFDRSIEEIKAMFLDLIGDFCADACEKMSFFDKNCMVGLADGVGNGRNIERLNGSEVDQFNPDALFGPVLAQL